MSPAVESSIHVAACLALFAGIGLIFLFVNLLVGWLVRPNNPHPEKLEIYECGEPTIGSSFVQFDLRFYVVALLFIIFDVEVAFFFPWATVFGKANQIAAVPADEPLVARTDGNQNQLTENGQGLYAELGVREPTLENVVSEARVKGSPAAAQQQLSDDARTLALLTIVDIVVFFVVLIVGFAYVWRRGDLDWVRAVSQERAQQPLARPPTVTESEPVLSA